MSKQHIDKGSDAVSVDQYNPGIERQEDESFLRYVGRRLVSRTSVDGMISDSKAGNLKRNLDPFHLTCLGVGSIIGSGIFVYSGTVAATNTGPAVVISFILAGFVAALSALCYSEIASMIPAAGSAYSYTYATMGEFVAWLVGWMLILEYMVGTAAVGVGWSGYLIRFFHDAFGITLDKRFIGAFVEFKEAGTVEFPDQRFFLTGNYCNLPAIAVIMTLTVMLILSTRQSATFTAVIVVLKVTIIFIFIFGSVDKIQPSNWEPFFPPAQTDYYGHFGTMGIFKGASVLFFCYVGFDAVATTALEAKNPKRDLPIGIISSLTISTLLYIAVALVMCGIASYTELNVAQPITIAIGFINRPWLGILVGLGAVIGMSTTMIGNMVAMSRVFFSMSNDGLIPRFFGKVHPSYRTPYISQAIVGTFASILAAMFPVDVLGELTGMGTLFGFCLVCLGTMILRIKRPDLPRGFKVPFGPYVIPLMGAASSAGLFFTSSNSALLRLLIWILIGVVVYFCYGFRQSRISHPDKFTEFALDVTIPAH
ncbi:hypothetical protein DSO57_1036990 [Entomophthora muscae]|uniref:Uncharacterized protein n=1 Tax=Entomophthora muscae TaxID=34485 RepID=A0ACC2RDV8_9FUNG|nr:hypothetical protein DSO57_1036990 [Entomophthora muscae]